jgi:hypothetical protein
MSLDLNRALYGQETSELFPACIKITHPIFPDAVRIVRDRIPLAHRGETYLEGMFNYRLPEEKAQGEIRTTIEIADPSRAVWGKIREIAAHDEKATGTFFIVMRSDPDNYVRGPFSLTLRTSTRQNAMVASIFSWGYDLTRNFNRHQYSPAGHGGLFA